MQGRDDEVLRYETTPPHARHSCARRISKNGLDGGQKLVHFLEGRRSGELRCMVHNACAMLFSFVNESERFSLLEKSCAVGSGRAHTHLNRGNHIHPTGGLGWGAAVKACLDSLAR